MRTYTIVVEPDESGDLVLSVPALPGCLTHGKTIEECKERAAEAIEVHIAGLIADGELVPEEDGELVPEEIEKPQFLTVTVAA
jgi:antitoxin HicB